MTDPTPAVVEIDADASRIVVEEATGVASDKYDVEPGVYGSAPAPRTVVIDQLARYRDEPLADSGLRLCAALGENRHAHLRPIDAQRTLCGKAIVLASDELTELLAARGRSGCSACEKRAVPGERITAMIRATQMVAKNAKLISR